MFLMWVFMQANVLMWLFVIVMFMRMQQVLKLKIVFMLKFIIIGWSKILVVFLFLICLSYWQVMVGIVRYMIMILLRIIILILCLKVILQGLFCLVLVLFYWLLKRWRCIIIVLQDIKLLVQLLLVIILLKIFGRIKIMIFIFIIFIFMVIFMSVNVLCWILVRILERWLIIFFWVSYRIFFMMVYWMMFVVVLI